jgi:hypothetical protein
MEGGSSGVILGLSLTISSLRYAPYLLVSLGGILGDILGGIMIFLVVLLVTATAIAAVEHCSCSVVFETFCLESYLWRKMCSLGYLLVLVLLPESFYLAKVMVLKGGCVPMFA